MGAWICVLATPAGAGEGSAYAQAPSAEARTQAATLAPQLTEPEGVTFTPFVDVGFAGDYENSPAGFRAALGHGMNNRIAVEGDFSDLAPDHWRLYNGIVLRRIGY